MEDEFSSVRALMHFDIELSGTKYPNRIGEINAPINLADINGEFVSHPDRFGYVSFLYREAEIRYEASKRDLEAIEARLDDEVRGRLKMIQTQDEKFKVTETIVAKQVKGDPRYVAQIKLVADTSALYKRLLGLRETLIERRYALISLASNMREGMAPTRILDKEELKERARENGRQLAARGGLPHLQAPGLPTTENEQESTPLPSRSRRKPTE